MNFDQLQTTLLKTARNDPPSDRVPYAFEQRVMARLIASPGRDVLAEWTSAFWRAAWSSMAVAAVLMALNFATPTHPSEALEAVDIAAIDFEMLAAQTDDPAAELL